MIDRADHGLERRRQNRYLVASAAFLLAFSQPQRPAHTDVLRLGRKRAPVDDRGALLGQHSFLGFGKPVHQQIRDCQVEHRVAQELQPFVMQLGTDRGARMSERHSQQIGTDESIVEPPLQVCAIVFRARRRRLRARRCSLSNFSSQRRTLDARCHHLNFVVPKYIGTLHQHADIVAAVTF